MSMDDRIFIQIPSDIGNLPAESVHSLEDIFEEIERICDENDELKTAISDMEDDIKENYRPISEYERIGMTEGDFA